MLQRITIALRNKRIMSTTKRLANNLKSLSAFDLAYVIVQATDICYGFRGTPDGGLLSSMIEEPQFIPIEKRYELYVILEDLLTEFKKENSSKISFSNASLGNNFTSKLEHHLRHTELAFQLLLSKIGSKINQDTEQINTVISAILSESISHIDNAVNRLRLADSASGDTRTPDCYEQLRQRSHFYATHYSDNN